MSDFAHTIGQLFMVGYPGPEPSSEFLEMVAREQLGGTILFQDNCPTYAAAGEAIAAIRAQYQTSTPVIAIDQEGGRVTRLKGAPAEFRAPASYPENGQLEAYTEDYRRSVLAMEALGINCNLTPVVDLHLNEENTVLDGRCFGRDAATAIPYIQKTIDISHSRGLLACAKHFPGLGAAAVDPHRASAEADYDFETWKVRERETFKAAVDQGVDLVMTTHLRIPAVDRAIATESPTIIGDMLRFYLGFDGPVITDDLFMDGARELGDSAERAIKAFLAGHDILLFGQDFHEATKAIHGFRKAVANGHIPEERLHQALERIASVKVRLARPAIL